MKTQFNGFGDKKRGSGNAVSDLAIEFGADGRLEREREHYRVGEKSLTVDLIRVCDRATADALGRQMGSYYCISTPCKFLQMEGEMADGLCKCIADKLRALTRGLAINRSKGKLKLLLVGLGNREMMVDSLGCAVCDRINLERTRRGGKTVQDGEEICVFTPGVGEMNGIDTSVAVGAISNAISPDIVILIDSLAARDTGRLFSTVQLSDCGITPGSGVGRKRSRLDSSTLQVPIISLGVPTVIALSSIIDDALDVLDLNRDDNLPSEIACMLGSGKDLLVSIGSCELSLKLAASIIAASIEEAFLKKTNE